MVFTPVFIVILCFIASIFLVTSIYTIERGAARLNTYVEARRRDRGVL
ncbi:MAG: hypothetical protein AAF850_03570 [Pseudomonadota bacterium]